MTTTAIGRSYEDAACAHLETLGYRVVTRNFRTVGGEIDIIAFDDDVLCFVEVRGRAADAFGDPMETIDNRKIGRVIHAARAYVATLVGTWPLMRFDVIGILDGEPIRLIRNAFDTSRVGAGPRSFA
ncbi:MAG: YraN family protein [Clostridia bacterium]|nr:YraN family protein [Deltaproteobacteria bacterium]